MTDQDDAADLGRAAGEPIAIVGMGCRLPGGIRDVRSYWRFLTDKRSAIVEVPKDRWSTARFYDPNPTKPNTAITKWGGFLDDIAGFDAEFFRVSPREALSMDPQQRLMLHATWDAFEDAGIPPDRLAGSDTGVYVGVSTSDYAMVRWSHGEDDVHLGPGLALSIVANRISHKFDLRGPSICVDTACSSSLVAVNLACHALRRHESALAIAGGVNVILTPIVTINFSKANMMSPDPALKAFDARANGYVRGEGAGVVILRRLSDAIANGDRIYSVIHSSVLGQNGQTTTITVPDRDAQSQMLTRACALAGVDPARIDYVEAHGTGTPIGDPIEANAIGAVFGAANRNGGRVLMGSVKPNIGHLEAGAGIAGLIKASLVAYFGEVVPNINFEIPNPAIPFADLKLHVPTEVLPIRPDQERFAVVNAFGFGGSNACVLLSSHRRTATAASDVRSATASTDRRYTLPLSLFPLSAATPAALSTRAGALADFAEQSGVPLGDIARQIAARHAHLDCRALVVAHTDDEAVSVLRAIQHHRMPSDVISGRRSLDQRLAFVFAGQGSQWWAMGRSLMMADRIYRSALEEFDASFTALSGWSVIQALTADSESASRIDETHITQPALCALQLGLVHRWRDWGITPDLVIGHSVGEIAAAYTAGVLTVQQAAALVYHRSRLPPARDGAIAAIGLPLEEAEALCATVGERLVEISGINSPTLISIAGDRDHVHAIVNVLERRTPAPFARLVRMNYAPHTSHVDCQRDHFCEAVAEIQTRRPTIPWISTVTGDFVRDAPGADYFWSNIRQKVQYQLAITRAYDAGYRTFLEIGPHPALSAPTMESAGGPVCVVASLSRQREDAECLSKAIAQLYVNGFSLNWPRILGAPAAHLDLPPYPLEEKTFWPESPALRDEFLTEPEGALLGMRQESPQPNWLSRVSVNRFPYLDDHVIDGSVLFPSAGYLETALQAARALYHSQPVAIEDARFDEAMFLERDQTYHLQTQFDPNRSKLSMCSRPVDGTTDFRRRAQMTLRARSITPVRFDRWPDALESGADADANDQTRFYETLKALGYSYGRTFQGVCSIVRCGEPGRVCATVALPSALHGEAADYVFHPALLDACLQVFAAALASIDVDITDTLSLPVGVKRLQVHRAVPHDLRVAATLTSHSRREFSADFLIADADLDPVATIQGFACRCLPRAHRATEPSVPAGLYEEVWKEQDLEASSELTKRARTVVIAVAGDFAGRALPAALELQGAQCRALQFAADIDGEAACARVQAEIAADCDTVISLLPLGVPDHGDLTAGQRLGTLMHLAIAKAFVPGRPDPPKLFVVTRNAAVLGDATKLNLANAPLSGFIRTLANEITELRPTAIDVDATTHWAMVAQEVLRGGSEHLVALRDGRRFVNRIERVAEHTLAPRCKPLRTENQPFRVAMATPGILDSLHLVETELAVPREDEVVISVTHVGVNFRDVMAATGALPRDAEVDPAWEHLGIECSGVVKAAGVGVTALQIGDKVMAQCRGAMRSEVVVSASRCLRVPDDFSLEQAAAIPTAFATALHCLMTVARLRRGERVLIHVATGGVGLASVQVARAIGAEIFATAGSDAKRDYLRRIGIQHVMDSRSLDFADEIMAITNGDGVDVVLNSLPGPFIEKGLDILKPFGRFIEIGKRDIFEDAPIGLKALRRNISLVAVDLMALMQAADVHTTELIELMQSHLASGGVAPLPATMFPVSRTAAAFRFMSQAQHIGKVVIAFDDPVAEIRPALDEPIRFPADGAYLITGGLSGFGFETAKWMVAHGARHLFLISRSGDDAALAAIGVLEERRPGISRYRYGGATLHAISGDVTRLEEVQHALEIIRSEGTPLRGVIHAAAVIDDARIAQQSGERFMSALAPKMIGAWNLHVATQGDPLDFFASFSSVAAMIGSPGQASYVAGNSFLDALAHVRRAHGLPALTINWGVISDVGFAERHPAMLSYLESLSLHAGPAAEALQMFGRLLRQHVAHVGFARIKWSELPRDFAGQERFRHLADPQSSSEAGGIFRELRLLDRPARHRRVVKFLEEQVARVLKTDPAALDSTRPLTEFGLDSLTSLELKNRLDTSLDTTLPVEKFLQRQTLEGLAEELSDILAARAAALAKAENAAAPGQAGADDGGVDGRVLFDQVRPLE